MFLPIFIPYPESIGFYNILTGIFSSFFTAADLGMANAVSRFIAEYRVKDPERCIQYIRFFIWFQSFLMASCYADSGSSSNRSFKSVPFASSLDNLGHSPRMPRLIAPGTYRGFRGPERGPSRLASSRGDIAARHVQRGTAKRVHVRRCRTRRVHGVHAPVPGTTCRWFAADGATRDLPARAGAHDSPPRVALDVHAPRSKHLVIGSSMWSKMIL